METNDLSDVVDKVRKAEEKIAEAFREIHLKLKEIEERSRSKE